MRGILAAMLCVVLPTTVMAQMLEVQPGARVRVRAPGALAGRLTGIVIARTPDSLTIARTNASPLAIPTPSLTTVELSRGKSRGAGALKGMVIGAGVGLLLGLTPLPEPTCTTRGCDPTPTRGEYMGTMILGSGVIGAGIGAIVGREQWDRYQLPAHVGLILPSHRRGVGLSLRYAFGRTAGATPTR